MIRQKKCFGTHPSTKGYGCGKMVNVENRVYGLGKMCCYGEWLFSSENGRLKLEKAMIYGKKKVKKEQKAKDKKIKENLTKWDAILRAEIQKIARLIDYGLPCLARGTRGQIHGGHIYATGGNKTMSYNLHNIHRQSAYSNHFQNDDGLLREGLQNEYGKEYFEFVSNLRRIEALKYSNEQYHSFYLKARQIALKLSKTKGINSLPDRIKLRNEINLELGIYKPEYCIYK